MPGENRARVRRTAGRNAIQVFADRANLFQYTSGPIDLKIVQEKLQKTLTNIQTSN